jgi:hypothetical protein
MTIIEDGKGKGSRAQVSNNRLQVKSIILSEEEYVSHFKGQAYCGTTGKTPLTNPNGVVLYFKNTSNTHLIAIETLLMTFSASGAMVSCQRNDTGTPGATTSVDQVNVNFESGNTAEADLYKSTAVSGLADGELIAVFHDLAAGRVVFPIDGTFILGKNNVFTVYVDNGAGSTHTGDISWTIRYRFVDKDI